jgi:UDP-N-acetylglucosamine--N-acetylmuramyl-(pentapeptide) pyrophosphoryl-undecaprenol N-acetylglucosamine transferase
MVTGNPVRSNIVYNDLDRDEAIRFFLLDPGKKTIFSTGGSLGAKGINEAIDAGIDEFEKNDLQLIWQTGKLYAARAKTICAGKKNVWTNDFITQMQYGYSAADVVISRSGAMSIAELCVAKKPVVFVPFPFSAEDHQTANAKRLVQKNAALMIKDSEAKEKLVMTVIALSKNEEMQNELKENIGKLAITDADEVIAKEILKANG